MYYSSSSLRTSKNYHKKYISPTMVLLKTSTEISKTNTYANGIIIAQTSLSRLEEVLRIIRR